jgi:hypothetical protein
MKLHDRSFIQNSVSLSLPRNVQSEGTEKQASSEGTLTTRRKVIADEHVALTDCKELKGAEVHRTPMA